MLSNFDDKMQNLKPLGISNKEQEVYIALLNTGITSAGELSTLTGVKRTTLYSCLELLKEKGLVTEITDRKKKYFQAVNPKGLKKVIENKVSELRKLEKDLPNLVNKYNSSKKVKPSSKIYKGAMSIPNLVEEVANSKTDIYFLGSIKGLQHYLGFDLLEKIYTRPRRKNLKTTDYLVSDWAASTIKRFHEEGQVFSKIRFLPPNVEPKGCFVTFENKLIVGQLFPEPNAFVIEDPTMVAMFKMSFLSLWKDLEGKYIPAYQSQS